MSERIRNGHKYYRYTIWNKENKKYRYLERKIPIENYRKKEYMDLYKLQEDDINWLLNRFKEPSSAFIPLHFIFSYHIEPIKVYELTFKDCKSMELSDETKRIINRQRNRIQEARLIFNHEDFNDYLCINLKTGNKLSHYQLDYIKKVYRKSHQISLL